MKTSSGNLHFKIKIPTFATLTPAQTFAAILKAAECAGLFYITQLDLDASAFGGVSKLDWVSQLFPLSLRNLKILGRAPMHFECSQDAEARQTGCRRWSWSSRTGCGQAFHRARFALRVRCFRAGRRLRGHLAPLRVCGIGPQRQTGPLQHVQ